MLENIKQILEKTPGLRGREIAKQLGVERRAVNSFLANSSQGLSKDSNSRWYLENHPEHTLHLSHNGWITSDGFENDLQKSGCLHSSESTKIVFKFPKKCKILISACARIMALSNQLVAAGKKVSLDFSECEQTEHFLDRLGVFDHLSQEIEVLPRRPSRSKAKIYKGNNSKLFELEEIDLSNPDETMPGKLTDAFVHNASEKYRTAALTIFGELVGNVEDHSKSSLPGFAALYKYGGKRPHIQTVVSDSGLGIATTLKKTLKKHYPDIHSRLDMRKIDSDIFLVKQALTKGGLSKLGPNVGHGLGLKRSQEYAEKYNADIIVRQQSFEIKLSYRNGKLTGSRVEKGLPAIYGTQVCFDFFLD